MQSMSEVETTSRTRPGAMLAGTVIALLCALGSLIWAYSLSGKISLQQAEIADARQKIADWIRDRHILFLYQLALVMPGIWPQFDRSRSMMRDSLVLR